ncbi:MAG: serine hydrolase [Chitinophagaceae bacterium]|nr:serine hydrolase [Chitinophagaceae bacterium]
MPAFRKYFISGIILFFSVFSACAQSLETQFDKLLSAEYKPGEPGAAVLIAKNGKVIYRKAFGNADLELNVPMKAENVFELGSITKQFTAVSVLMLMEQGKLQLDNSITRFIPDYPTQGKKITVHQLLNHTSGIKSYTDMDNFKKLARTDMSPTELIDVFKNEPMDFDPGEKWKYNNSGYILLGYIIEKVSGQSYASFIENNIFKKLGMTHSYYGSQSALIPNRAKGYQPKEKGFENADYLSMTLPYAAGSLMSTVDDMLLWSQAIHNNTLISSKSKEKAFTNYKLNNGDADYYGYGWQPNEINGIATVEHGGGIFGYTTMGIYAPAENLYAIVLTNTSGKSPTDITIKLAALALGKPYATKPLLQLTREQLQQWVGTYEFVNGVLRTISLENDTLYSQREGSTKLKLIPTGTASFNFEGTTTQYEFAVENGKRTALMKDRIQKFKGSETDKKFAPEKKPVDMDASALQQYTGQYQLAPQFIIEITTEGNQIFAQATGQPKFEIFAEKPDTFFLKVVQASIDFNKDPAGNVISLTLHQGGRDTEGKKIK